MSFLSTGRTFVVFNSHKKLKLAIYEATWRHKMNYTFVPCALTTSDHRYEPSYSNKSLRNNLIYAAV